MWKTRSLGVMVFCRRCLYLTDVLTRAVLYLAVKRSETPNILVQVQPEMSFPEHPQGVFQELVLGGVEHPLEAAVPRGGECAAGPACAAAVGYRALPWLCHISPSVPHELWHPGALLLAPGVLSWLIKWDIPAGTVLPMLDFLLLKTKFQLGASCRACPECIVVKASPWAAP